MNLKPSLEEIKGAYQRIKPYINNTPVLTNTTINNMAGAEIDFKCENFQKVGAFKMRGATNAVFSLSEEEAKMGVATHSSGNHAAALALAARLRGIKAYVVMPENAPRVKQHAVEGYGAEIVHCKPTLQAREEGLETVIKKTGAVFIHPYNDHRVISGQGTALLEYLEEYPSPDYILTPVGGGGLLSGTALTAHYLSPGSSVIAGEPAGADDAFRSLKAGTIIPSVNPKTIADGLLTSLGSLTFPIIQEYVSEIITVADDEIIFAMRLIWERMKIIVEPSSAVPLAVMLKQKEKFKHNKAVVILSGGNVNLDQLPW